jgi:hypothetical protein
MPGNLRFLNYTARDSWFFTGKEDIAAEMAPGSERNQAPFSFLSHTREGVQQPLQRGASQNQFPFASFIHMSKTSS